MKLNFNILQNLSLIKFFRFDDNIFDEFINFYMIDDAS